MSQKSHAGSADEILYPALSQSRPRDNLTVAMQTSCDAESDVRSRVLAPGGEGATVVSGGRGTWGLNSKSSCACDALMSAFKALYTMCRFDSGDDLCREDGMDTGDLSHCCGDSERKSQDAVPCWLRWPGLSLLSPHLSSDTQLQRSQIANSSQFHLASSPVTQLTSSQKQETNQTIH